MTKNTNTSTAFEADDNTVDTDTVAFDSSVNNTHDDDYPPMQTPLSLRRFTYSAQHTVIIADNVDNDDDTGTADTDDNLSLIHI